MLKKPENNGNGKQLLIEISSTGEYSEYFFDRFEYNYRL